MSPRNSSVGEVNLSHGRGGAGNMSKQRRESFKEDFVTPTIKSETYTTGRGGSGNMAKNDPLKPEIARARQDVDAPFHREPENTYRVGRGGAGNLGKLTDEEKKLAKQRNESGGAVLRKSQELGEDRPTGTGAAAPPTTTAAAGANGNGESKGWAEKGKDILGKLKK